MNGGKEYDLKETIRSFVCRRKACDMVWTSIYCSAQCYTKAIMDKPSGFVEDPMATPLPNVVYLVIRHMGEWDDYTTTALAAFKDEAKAKTYCDSCNAEVERIKKEMKILETEYADIFILPEREETEEEIDKHGKRSMEFANKQIKIYDTHLHDNNEINTDIGLNYQYTEIKLY